MNLTEWRAARQGEVTLPSGLVVTLGRCDLQTLLFEGRLPKPLLGMIADISDGKGGLDFNNAQSVIDHAEQLPELLELFNVVARAAVIAPPLADVSDDTHISIGELSLADRQAIYEWATTGAQAIAPFPESSERVPDPGQPGAEIQPAPVIVS